jgi:transposase InsO family protein
MSLRAEFVAFASQPDANVAAACRRFGVSRKTGYKWLARAAAGHGLADRSRRPRASPARTAGAVERLVVALRGEHPAWGARKLKRRLEDLGHAGVPARSTVNAILARHGLIDPAASAARGPTVRFERAAPNELWQMDFKGHFATGDGARCHPLTVLDDHSRFNVVLRACADERLETVRAALADAMRRYGMPAAFLADNGSPWGNAAAAAADRWTALGVWLVRRGVGLLHGRPGHPQTQGKEERFHRTLAAEAIGARSFRDTADCQRAFDAWRDVYNLRRPHEALGLATPATRYAPSPRAFVEAPPPFEYGPGDAVRRVCAQGCVSVRGRPRRLGKAFAGERVAVRPTTADGVFGVYYCHAHVTDLDVRGDGGRPAG